MRFLWFPMDFGWGFQCYIFLGWAKRLSYFRSTYMNNFNDFISRATLADAGFSSNNYSWFNNQDGATRIWERLDKVLLVLPFMLVTFRESDAQTTAPFGLRWRPIIVVSLYFIIKRYVNLTQASSTSLNGHGRISFILTLLSVLGYNLHICELSWEFGTGKSLVVFRLIFIKPRWKSILLKISYKTNGMRMTLALLML